MRTTRPWRVAGVFVAVALLAGACDLGPISPHDALTAGAEPLRSHFNRDVGHARIVLLAAPT